MRNLSSRWRMLPQALSKWRPMKLSNRSSSWPGPRRRPRKLLLKKRKATHPTATSPQNHLRSRSISRTPRDRSPRRRGVRRGHRRTGRSAGPNFGSRGGSCRKRLRPLQPPTGKGKRGGGVVRSCQPKPGGPEQGQDNAGQSCRSGDPSHAGRVGSVLSYWPAHSTSWINAWRTRQAAKRRPPILAC